MIYFISDGNGFIKIGRSTNVNQRIKQMQTGNAHKLILLSQFKTQNDKEMEQRIHDKYAKFRYRGEWFSIDGIDKFWIGEVKIQLEKEDERKKANVDKLKKWIQVRNKR